jgi:hypothetical protein
MTTEELRMVIEAVRGLGEDARYVMLWWLIVEVLKHLMVPASFVVIGAFALRGWRMFIGSQEWVAAARDVARAWGARDPDYSTMYRADKEAMTRAIAAGQRKGE